MLSRHLLAALFGSACLATSVASVDVDDKSYITLVDNCKDLDDGSYYMKLMEDSVMTSDGSLFDADESDEADASFPIVKVKCSNGFMILDVNHDEELVNYFTSWAMWHASIAGPDNSDIVDWDNWFMQSRLRPSGNKFLLSPDCSTCEQDHVRQHFGYKSTYWMSGNLFGCFWMFLGKHNCDLDKDTYACYQCSMTSSPDGNGDATEILESDDPDAYYYTGQCATAIRNSDSQVTASHDTCQLGLDWTVADTIYGTDYESDYTTNKLYSRQRRQRRQRRMLLGAEHEIEIEMEDDEHEELSPSAFDVSDFEAEIFKPSLGTDGRFCVCAQNEETHYMSVTHQELEAAMKRFGDRFDTFAQFSSHAVEALEPVEAVETAQDAEEIAAEAEEAPQVVEAKTSSNNRIELRAKDFEHGTYRIQESGTYVIMEDIEFDFNAGFLDDPQAEGAWKPLASQVEQYPGAESGRDEYFLGFFAGITIECDDVVLDLNGFSIGMSDVFYHQQRWFTTISLTSQFFLPGNGPGFFGYDPRSATNVLIKDGTIGLSSHFGIHGNYNSDVRIENVHIRDFEVHGIQFNGFERLHLKNVEVGPSSKKAFFTGEYGHMRYVLDRLNNMIQDLEDSGELPNAYMNYYGRDAEHLSDIAARTERMMNYAFDYVVKAQELHAEDFADEAEFEEYQQALDIFVNPSGIPYASVLHGIFLNTKEASVMTYNLKTTTYSESAVLENVKIHDLTHAMDERVRMYNDIYMFFGPFLNCLSARQLLGDEVVDDAESRNYLRQEEIPFQYKGSVVTDVYLALTKFSNNWDYLEKMLTGAHVLVPWSEGEAQLPPGTNIACNMDVMIHSGKGTTGLRLDGVKDVKVSNLEVYNLHDATPSGETVCGEYYKFMTNEGGGHLAQQMPMQEGFSGNKVQGLTLNSAVETKIDGIKMYNLRSDTGPIMGVAVWPANDVIFAGEMQFEDIRASTALDFDEGDEAVTTLYPNQDHFACAMYLYESYVNGPSQYTTELVFDDSASLTACGIENQRAGIDAYESCYKFDTPVGLGSDGQMTYSNVEHRNFVAKANLKSLACKTVDTDEVAEVAEGAVGVKEEEQVEEVGKVEEAEEAEPMPEMHEDLDALEKLQREEIVENVAGTVSSSSGNHGAARDWGTMKLFGFGAVVVVVFGLVYRWYARKEAKVSFVGNSSNYGTLSA